MKHDYKTDLAGIAYKFTRRRYSAQTYTWIYAVRSDGKQLRNLDPWPCITPKKSELEKELLNEANWI